VIRPAAALFSCLFASQAGTLVLSPILVEVAQDFEVSTATAGQLRAISGIVAGMTAVTVGMLAGRIGLKRLLLAGLGLLALAAGLSALAPSFAALAAAQVPLGIAIAILLSSGVAGATAWIPPDRRADALSAAFSGQAVAWLVGMPIVGAVSEVSWRLAWIALPLAATVPALVLVVGLEPVRSRPASLLGDLAVLARDRTVAGWWLGELFAFSAWVGMLVYAGALLVDSYDLSLPETGAALGAIFLAYLPGTILFRRWVFRFSRRLLVLLGLGAAADAALIGSIRPALWITVFLLGVYVFLNSGRTIAGSAFGLTVAPEHAVAAMGFRASATQFGYLLGAGLGGVALAFGDFEALGAVFAGLYLLAVAFHALPSVRRGRPRSGSDPGSSRSRSSSSPRPPSGSRPRRRRRSAT
jgi:DHA1 family inner membrane transport protein